MHDALRQRITLADFLPWEERQERKYEFDGLRAVLRADVDVAHATIQSNLVAALHPRLRDGPCEFFGSALKFVTAGGTVRYPDGMVVCSRLDGKAKFVENPTIVFEILSPSTSVTDRIVKAREYPATPSVRRYVMIEQNSRAAVVYARAGEAWTHQILISEGVLSLPEVGVEFPLAELYEGLKIAAPGEDQTPGRA